MRAKSLPRPKSRGTNHNARPSLVRGLHKKDRGGAGNALIFTTKSSGRSAQTKGVFATRTRSTTCAGIATKAASTKTTKRTKKKRKTRVTRNKQAKKTRETGQGGGAHDKDVQKKRNSRTQWGPRERGVERKQFCSIADKKRLDGYACACVDFVLLTGGRDELLQRTERRKSKYFQHFFAFPTTRSGRKKKEN